MIRSNLNIINQDQKQEGIANNSKVKSLLLTILIIIIFVVGVGAGYLVYNRLTEKEGDNEGNIEQREVVDILDELGEIILLPESENPTVAKLIDISELKKENEIFYKDAQEGDIMIIYSDRAIIFRRAEKRIVNIAPVYIETDALSE